MTHYDRKFEFDAIALTQKSGQALLPIPISNFLRAYP
jgi:hypothetical protein